VVFLPFPNFFRNLSELCQDIETAKDLYFDSQWLLKLKERNMKIKTKIKAGKRETGLKLWRCSLVVLASIFIFILDVSAQDPKLTLGKSYLLISTERESTFKKELNEAAASGYSVLFGAPGSGVALMEKADTNPACEYLLLKKEDELNEAAARGFRLLPHHITGYSSFMVARPKGVEPKERYEYRVVNMGDISKQDGKTARLVGQGYQLVDAAHKKGVFERPVAAGPSGPTPSGAAADRYLHLSTLKTSTMQKEIDEAISKGYRPLLASSDRPIMTIGQIGLFNSPQMQVVLEKRAAPSETYECLLLTTNKFSTLEKEMNEAATRGFRAIPRTFAYTGEYILLMEKTSGSVERYSYQSVKGDGLEFERALSQLSTQGFHIVDMIHLQIVLLEKPEK
jgi:hypothetical protein